MKKAITTQAKPDYIDIDGDGNKKESMKEAAKSITRQMSEDHKMAYDRAEIARLKNDIHDDDLNKKGMSQMKAPTYRFKDFDQMDTYDAKETAGEKSMASKKSCAYQHGQSKGDQSATHTDYANYKGTDKGYHGKDGSSHGDQSATHRDYAHPILKHMKRNK